MFEGVVNTFVRHEFELDSGAGIIGGAYHIHWLEEFLDRGA